ncbi:MAG: DUF2780 domain-containing protein [Planctomycetota bacterium]
MQEFIKMAVDGLGVSESTATSATGGVLGFLKEEAGSELFGELASKIPGAADLANQVSGAAEGGSSGGGLGGMLGKAASMVGGGTTSAMGLVGVLTKSGLDFSKAGSFVSMFMDFVKQKAGADLVGKLLAKVPEIAKVAG